MRIIEILTLTALCCSLLSCGDGEGPVKEPSKHTTESGMARHSHGVAVPLGTMKVGSHDFTVKQVGGVGIETGFLLAPKDPAWKADAVSLFAWLEDGDGGWVCSETKINSGKDNHYHFHMNTEAGKETATHLVVRLKKGADVDARASVPISRHLSAHGAHDGLTAPFTGGATGVLELKLHDDKGDLELWLCKDASSKNPLDVPLDTVVEVTFLDRENRTVSLEVRNRVKNEDESGAPSIRDGKTHYFIFPGNTDADATWLMGKDFASRVVVKFTVNGAATVSPCFILMPHTHETGDHEH